MLMPEKAKDRFTSIFIYDLNQVRLHCLHKDTTLKDYVNDLIKADMNKLEETD